MGTYQSIHPTEVIRSSSASVCRLFLSSRAEAINVLSVQAYYLPNKGRSNLHVITGAHVTRVLFHGEKKQGKLVASGAEFSKDGQASSVSATKEVIICGGPFQFLSSKEFLTCDQDPSKHLRSSSYLVRIFYMLRGDIILSINRYRKQEAPRVARYSRSTRSSGRWSESSYVILLRLAGITTDINRSPEVSTYRTCMKCRLSIT